MVLLSYKLVLHTGEFIPACNDQSSLKVLNHMNLSSIKLLEPSHIIRFDASGVNSAFHQYHFQSFGFPFGNCMDCGEPSGSLPGRVFVNLSSVY